MIIVEGPDGGGKTTLVNMLVEFLDMDVEPRACTSENGIDMTTLKAWVDHDLSRPVHGRGLYDRYPLISEPIYGPLTRGRMADGFGDVQWLQRTLRVLGALDPVLIFCLPPLSVVKTNIQAHHNSTTEHMSQVNRQATALWHAYCHRAAVAAEHEDAMIWDYTSPDSDAEFKVILEECQEYGR